MEAKHRKYVIVMILCFLFGGFSIILYMLVASMIVWRSDVISAIRSEEHNVSFPIFTNRLERNVSGLGNMPAPERRGFVLANPSELLFSPFSITFLFSGIVSTVAGLSIWNLIREKEIRSAKKTILDAFLLPEEKNVMDTIEKCGGSIAQNQIARDTGFSRVKVHRIVRNLEMKKLVTKKPYGMTNKIVLKDG